MGLRTLLQQKKHIKQTLYFKVYNHTQGGKYTLKHVLDITTLTADHEDALNLHAIALVGANGKQDHAIAIVNDMIFDSSATHAMYLCCEALDWCSNCKGGYGKAGCILLIKIEKCQFKVAKLNNKKRFLSRKKESLAKRHKQK